MVPDRNPFERVLRAIREILTIVVLMLALYLMVTFSAVLADVGNRLNNPDSGVIEPAPTDTGCPFGEGECGG